MIDNIKLNVTQYFASMDGGHPAFDPIPHRHKVTLDWYRTEFTFAYSLFPKWDIQLEVPYDIKDQKVSYEALDGQPYDSPTGNLHHRTERLEKLGDIRILFNHFINRLLLSEDHIHFGIGLYIPTGKIEDNPYKLGALGIQHRHIQFGTGTFDPIFRTDYRYERDWWGLEVSTTINAKLYENRKGYKGASDFDYKIGPTAQITNWLGMGIHYTGIYQTRAFWDGDPDKNSGYNLRGIFLSAPIALSPTLTIIPMALYPTSVDVRSGADIFEMDWMLLFSLELIPTNKPQVKKSLFN